MRIPLQGAPRIHRPDAGADDARPVRLLLPRGASRPDWPAAGAHRAKRCRLWPHWVARLPHTQLQALTELDISNSDYFRVLPESIGQLQALTRINLRNCNYLSRLPETISQLQALTDLDLSSCDSLSVRAERRGNLLETRNRRIVDERGQRFSMTVHAFASTVLFGSMLPSSAHVAAGAQEDDHLARVRIGACPDGVLSKLSSDGPHHASLMKRRVADYCGEGGFCGLDRRHRSSGGSGMRRSHRL